MQSEEKEPPDDDGMMAAWFLGPKLENVEMLQKLSTLSFSKLADFRQNYFPMDTEGITKEMKTSDDYKHQMRKLDDEFNKLCRELDMSNNFASVRWQGPPVGDTTLPSSLGYIASLCFNANNHSNNSSPATTAMEVEVCDNFCEMLGYDIKTNPIPWSHLTSGGTMSNIEALWCAEYIKYHPLAIQKSAMENEDLAKFISNKKIYVPALNSHQNILDVSAWNLMNLDTDDVIDLNLYIQKQPNSKMYNKMIDKYTLRHLGWHRFMKTFALEEEPIVFVSSAGHFSFSKAMQVLGLGDESLFKVIGLDKNGYGRILERCVLGGKLLYCKLLMIGDFNDLFICMPLQPLPVGWALEDAKSFIKRHVDGKDLSDITKCKKTMSFLREVGSDTCINPFVINMKSGGKFNSYVNFCNSLNSEIYCRLSHVNNRHSVRRTPLILGKSFMNESENLKCRLRINKLLHLRGSGGLAILLFSVMNPWIINNGRIDIIGNVLRQAILDSIGMLTDIPARHCFVAAGIINNSTVFGEYCSASFSKPSHQYQACVKFKFVNDADATLLLKYQRNQNRKQPQDRKQLFIQNSELDVLGHFLNRATDGPYYVDCYIGFPGDQDTISIPKTAIMVEDIPLFRHFDMTKGESDKWNYFLYGDQNRAYISHRISQSANFIQIVDVPQIPDGIPLNLLEHGIKITIDGIFNSKKSQTKQNSLTKSQYNIKYIGQNGELAVTSTSLNLNNAEVFFNYVESSRTGASHRLAH